MILYDVFSQENKFNAILVTYLYRTLQSFLILQLPIFVILGSQRGDPNDPPPGGLNLKLLLTGEEIKYLFGAEEVLLDQLKQQANLKITLSEKGPHERVLCIPGDVETVFKAFSLVSRKLWEFVVSLSDPSNPRMLVLRNSLDCHFL